MQNELTTFISKNLSSNYINIYIYIVYTFLYLESEQCMNCDYTNVLEKDLAKAKVLFPTVASVIGSGGRADITLNANFYELGGNSLNSIYTVTKLRDQGYEIGITEFITAKNLAEVLDRMKISTEDVIYENSLNEEEHIFEMLNDSHKKDVIEYVKFILKIFFKNLN